MFNPIVTLTYTLPSERYIAATLEMIQEFCTLAREELVNAGTPFVMPTFSRIPELAENTRLTVQLYQRGEASVDECLMFLVDQKALLAGPLLAALMAPDVLPIGISCISFGNEEIDYYGVGGDDAPALICFERETGHDVCVYFCQRDRGWRSEDYFLLARLIGS